MTKKNNKGNLGPRALTDGQRETCTFPGHTSIATGCLSLPGTTNDQLLLFILPDTQKAFRLFVSRFGISHPNPPPPLDCLHLFCAFVTFARLFMFYSRELNANKNKDNDEEET